MEYLKHSPLMLRRIFRHSGEIGALQADDHMTAETDPRTRSPGAAESNASRHEAENDMRFSDTSAHSALVKEPDSKIRFSDTTAHSATVNELISLTTTSDTTAHSATVNEVGLSKRSLEAGTLAPAHEPVILCLSLSFQHTVLL